MRQIEGEIAPSIPLSGPRLDIRQNAQIVKRMIHGLQPLYLCRSFLCGLVRDARVVSEGPELEMLARTGTESKEWCWPLYGAIEDGMVWPKRERLFLLYRR